MSRITKNISVKVLIFLLLITGVHMLSATWSIVAVDPETGEVGSAGASYTPAVWPILGIAGGQGVVVAQAASNESGRVMAQEMIGQGKSPEDIFAIITTADFDKYYAHQQYGIATLKSGSGAYTGAACTDWAGHDGTDYVSVQANIMASDHVVSDALAAFHNAERKGLPLADRLMAALLAGSNAGGDSRAGEDTAMTAYLAVAKTDDPPGHPSFAIIIPPQGKGINPVKVLSTRFALLKGSVHPIFFPSLTFLLISLICIPVLTGMVTAVFITLKQGSRKFGLVTFKVLGIDILVAVLNYFIFAGLSLLFSWAVPIYGAYTWMFPALISVLGIILFFIIRLVFLIIRRYRKL